MEAGIAGGKFEAGVVGNGEAADAFDESFSVEAAEGCGAFHVVEIGA